MPHQLADQHVVVSEKLEILKAKSHNELVALPNQCSESVNANGKSITLTVWHDVLASKEHLIAVQVYKPGFLGFGRMYADGFVVNSRDERRELTQDEWAEFS